jgi:putative ABC transport system permease protein
VESIPGVMAASLSLGLPLEGAQIGMPFQLANHPRVPDAQSPMAPFELVSDGFFQVMGITLRTGRYFTQHDTENSAPVAIVNEAFAQHYLPDENPVGKRLLMQSLVPGNKEAGPVSAREIVGVVANVRYQGLDDKRIVSEIYVPLMQSPWPGVALALRTARDPSGAAQAARAALAQVDPDVPVTSVKTMDQIAADSLTQSRVQTWLIGSFAGVALIMAALGIYALISYSVAQGTHDLGVRMALGADRSDILRVVLWRAISLTAAGLLLGSVATLALTRLLSSLLFQVEPTDFWTLIIVSLVLAAVALLAGAVPAIRASRIDPLAALRCE